MPNNTSFNTFSAPEFSESFKQELEQLLWKAQDYFNARSYSLSEAILNQVLQRCREHSQHQSLYSLNAIIALCQLDYRNNKKERILSRLDTIYNVPLHYTNENEAKELPGINTLMLRADTMYGIILQEQGNLVKAKEKLDYAVKMQREVEHHLNEQELFTLLSTHSEVLNAMGDFNNSLVSAHEAMNFLLHVEKNPSILSVPSSASKSILNRLSNFFFVQNSERTTADRILALRFYLAEVYTKMGDYASAEREGELALQHPHIKHVDAELNIKIHHHLGYTAYLLGHEEKALLVYKALYDHSQCRALLSGDQYARLLSDLASLYAHKNDINQVNTLVRKIIQTQVQWAMNFLSLAHVYQKQKNYIQARNQYELALIMYSSKPELFKTLPSIPDIQQNLGFLNNQLDEYEAAKKYLHRALGSYRLNTGNDIESAIKTIKALQQLAFAHRKTNKEVEAETKLNNAFEIIEKAYRQYPSIEQSNTLDEPCVVVTTDLAQLYIDQKRFDDALTLLNKAKTSLPIHRQLSHFKIDVCLGDIYSAKEQHSKAEQAYKNALTSLKTFYKILPKNIESNKNIMQAIPEILQKLATVYQKQGNFRDAVEYLKHNNALDYLKYDPTKTASSFSYKDNKQVTFVNVDASSNAVVQAIDNITHTNLLANRM